MTTMWSTDSLQIQTLMREINDATLVLPQFQRQSVWTPANWIPFLGTIVKGRPTGTLLLLESGDDHQDFAPRPIETAPALGGKIKWLLLDGQQRLTTLYRALHSHFEKRAGGPKYEFVICVKDALDRGELLDGDFLLVKRTAVPGFAELATNGQVTLRTMYDAGEFENWKSTYVAQHLAPLSRTSGDLINALKEVMPGAISVADYAFPLLKIDRTTPLDVVVDIFEGMNRRGQKLDQFDLMVARLYRPLANGSRYDLRAAWEGKLGQLTHLPSLGVDDDDGMLPLKLIAKRVSRLGDASRPPGVKGMNNKDVLELPPEQIIGGSSAPDPTLSLDIAVDALEAAAEFLRRVCGVKSSLLLPQKSMLLPLADQFLRAPGKRLSEANLKRWFASIGLRGDYYGSVNSYADSDCDDLARWADEDVIPNDVSTVNRAFVEQLSLLQACSRDGRILGVTVMSMLVAAGARDWEVHGLTIASKPDAVELHHVVPKRRLNLIRPKTETRDPIAGLTPLSTAANARVSDKQPVEVLGDLGGDASPILATHRIDRVLLESGFQSNANYEAFLEDRERQLRAFLIAALGL